MGHTGCGLDYHRIWTSDNCTTAAGIQGFFSRAGNAAHEAKHPLRCMPVFKTLGTRCCADLFKVKGMSHGGFGPNWNSNGHHVNAAPLPAPPKVPSSGGAAVQRPFATWTSPPTGYRQPPAQPSLPAASVSPTIFDLHVGGESTGLGPQAENSPFSFFWLGWPHWNPLGWEYPKDEPPKPVPKHPARGKGKG